MTGCPHRMYRAVATVFCLIGASAGAPEGFATWTLLAVVACSSAVILGARHAGPVPARAVAHSTIEAAR